MTGLQATSIARVDKEWRFIPEDAAAAIISIEDKGYLMQHRDDIPNILFPDYFGFFGGAVEGNEKLVDALKRELQEEIGLEIETGRYQYHTKVTYDFGCVGKGIIDRAYYRISIDQEELSNLVLGEGRDYRVMTAHQIFAEPYVIPFDAWALWLLVNGVALSQP